MYINNDDNKSNYSSNSNTSNTSNNNNNTHLQLFTENEFGRSKYCSSQEFEDHGAGEEL